MASDAGSIQNWCHVFCERNLRLGRRRLLRSCAGGGYRESRCSGQQSWTGSPEKPCEQNVSAHRAPPHSAENRKKTCRLKLSGIDEQILRELRQLCQRTAIG